MTDTPAIQEDRRAENSPNDETVLAILSEITDLRKMVWRQTTGGDGFGFIKHRAEEIIFALNELLTLRAALSGSGWMPIESAPKNKILLLGYWNRLGNWRTVRGSWSDEVTDCNGDTLEPGWFEISENADEEQNHWDINPTHWQPLPATPKDKRE